MYHQALYIVVIFATFHSATPQACTDTNPADCAAKKQLCSNSMYKDLMKKKCPATCGMCDDASGAATTAAAAAAGDACADVNAAECAQKSFLCSNAAYTELMKKKCPATCGMCGDSSAAQGGADADTCADVNAAECAQKSFLCSNAAYTELMKKKCPATCGMCGDSSADNFYSKKLKNKNQQIPASASDSSNAATSPQASQQNASSQASNAPTTVCQDDPNSQCKLMSTLCNNDKFKDTMKQFCPKTCKVC
uniref:ShTK domain protein n=1 Tax=Syphacia muris TaxID=451379 RepID=A0A158R540_9BILA